MKKAFLVVFTSLAVASATVVQFSPTLYTADIPITTQYHAQDSLGQYSYGYSGGPSAKTEYKSLDGVIRGSYSYVDSNGKLQTVEYTADGENGFQASATNLPKAPIDDKVPPKPVEDTPEVAMAKSEHFAAVREAQLRAAEHPSNGDGNGNNGEDTQLPQQNGSQEQAQATTSAETESPNGSDASKEGASQESTISGSSTMAANGNGNGNGKGNGNGNTGLTTNGLANSLVPVGISSTVGTSLLNGLNALNLNSLNNGNNQLGTTASGFKALSSLRLNENLPSGLDIGSDTLRLSEIPAATTTDLRTVGLTSVPATSYLSVSTPTHGYSIVAPTVLTAVPTLRGKSSQTISRTLPISLTPTFLKQGLL